MERRSIERGVYATIILGLLSWQIIRWTSPYFSGAKMINPILAQIAGWKIHWYGFFMAMGVLIAWRWLTIKTRGTKLAEADRITDLVIWLTLGGIIGARLLFVFLKWPEFAGDWGAILNLTEGGLSIHGAIIGGGLATFIYCRYRQWPVTATFDLLIPPLIMGQIIGRVGNFFNQEAFGGPTNLPWKMWVAPIYRPEGYANSAWFHPTFLYEMIGLGLILWLIFTLIKKTLSAGTITLVYLISYSILRFEIEFFRIDSDKWGALSVAQWGSIAIIMGGLIIGLILKRRRNL